ncbi:hypothetical protein ACOCGI_003676 [Vibrio cholerae]
MKLNKLSSMLVWVVSVNVFAFGGVVTDPGSYSYYATQIEQAIKQVKLAEDQVKQATKTYDKIVNVDKSITGNLMRAKNELARIKSLQDMSLSDVRKSMQYAKKALDEVADIPEYKDDISKEIDKTFGEEAKNNDWVNVEAQKRASKQKALKQAVIDAELAQGKIDLQRKQLEELAEATNQTDDLKDATDVTNTALIQMLEGQQEMITLLANISKNLALSDYNGGEESNGYIINGKDLRNPEEFGIKGKRKAKSASEILKECPLFTGCTYK